MNEQKRSKPERKRLSIAKDAMSVCSEHLWQSSLAVEQPMPSNLVLILRMRAWIVAVLFKYSMFHLYLSTGSSGCQSQIGYLVVSLQPVQMSV